MSIQADSKKILQYFLDIAIEQGSLDFDLQLSYLQLSENLKLPSANYCKICCQYLAKHGYVHIFHDAGRVEIFPNGIDFLES